MLEIQHILAWRHTQILSHGKPDHLTSQPVNGTIQRSGILSWCLRILIEKLSETDHPCDLTKALRFLKQHPQLNAANVAPASPDKVTSERFVSTDVAAPTAGCGDVIKKVPCSLPIGHKWQQM